MSLAFDPRATARFPDIGVDDGLDDHLLGDSLAMHRVRGLIRKVARTSLPVLIQGPTGAGKELVAVAIHRLSQRVGRLVAFNVCAVADTMFDDALFGHVRGAFSGAVHGTDGYLSEADRGTLFLDELSGLPLMAQAKLLRAIETRTFRPVGAERDRSSEFRVVAASNENLDAAADDGRFRADLLHRLSGITIEVPPLAERLEDVPLLARRAATEHAMQCGMEAQLTDAAVDELMGHDWPGNVRELRLTVSRAITLAPTTVVGREDVRGAIRRMTPARGTPGVLDADDRRLLAALQETGADVTAAAARLGMHRATVYRRLRKLQSIGVVPSAGQGVPLR